MHLWASESSKKLMGQEEECLVFPGGGEWAIALEIRKERPFHRVPLQKAIK